MRYEISVSSKAYISYLISRISRNVREYVHRQYRKAKEYGVCQTNCSLISILGRGTPGVHYVQTAASKRNQHWRKYCRSCLWEQSQRFCCKAANCGKRGRRNPLLAGTSQQLFLYSRQAVPIPIQRLQGAFGDSFCIHPFINKLEISHISYLISYISKKGVLYETASCRRWWS